MRTFAPFVVACAVIGCSSDVDPGIVAKPVVAELVWTLQSDSFPDPLVNVAGVASISNTTAVVADRDRVHLIDSRSGRHLRSAGRAGNGPGEFRRVSWIQRVASGVVVFDEVHGRLTFLDDTLGLDSIRSPYDVDGEPRCVTGDGALVTTRSSNPSEARFTMEPGLYQPRLRLGVLTDTMWSDLDEVTSDARWIVVETSGYRRNVFIIAVPFAPRFVVRCGPDPVVWADSSAARLRMHQDGRTVDVELDGLVARAVSAADYGAVADSADATGIDGLRGWIVQASEAVPMQSIPAFRDLLIAPDGHVWALHYLLTDDRAKLWTRYTTAGERLETVQLPNEVEVVAVAPNMLLGWARDSLGVPQVRAYAY